MKQLLVHFTIFENLGIVILAAGLFVKTPSSFTNYPLFSESYPNSYYHYLELSLLEYCQQCLDSNMFFFKIVFIVLALVSVCLTLYILHLIHVRSNKCDSITCLFRKHVDSSACSHDCCHDKIESLDQSELINHGKCLRVSMSSKKEGRSSFIMLLTPSVILYLSIFSMSALGYVILSLFIV